MAGFTTTRQRPANARQPNRWVPSPHGGDLLVVARCRWLTRKGCRRCSVHRFGGYPVRKQHKIVKFDTNKLDGLSRLNFPAVGSRNSRRPAPASFDTAKACVGCTYNRLGAPRFWLVRMAPFNLVLMFFFCACVNFYALVVNGVGFCTKAGPQLIRRVFRGLSVVIMLIMPRFRVVLSPKRC